METIVGRDPQTQQLCVTTDGRSRLYGQPGSVPMDVSRHHFSLQPAGSGKWHISNLNERNVTFVNGMAVERKTVTAQDKVELGRSCYLFPWDALSEPEETTIDLQQLKQVWDDYQQEEIAIRNRQKNTGLLSSIPLGFSMLGGIIAGIAPDIRGIALLFTGIALVLFLYGLWKRSQDNTAVELKRLQEDFERKWVCPKCRRPLSFRSYAILEQHDACPYCKTKLKK